MDTCFYFQLHQPYRLRRYRVFDIGGRASYFDDALNRDTLLRVAARCYTPTLEAIGRMVNRAGARFGLSVSGVLVEQLAEHAPSVLETLQSLVTAGGVELLGETSHHSLTSLADAEEFTAQMGLHRAAMKRWFGVQPTVFRNTELIIDDGIARRVAALGFAGVLVEGADRVLESRSPNHVYASASATKLRLMPRNYRLSDDVAFRFADRNWDAYPLTVEKYANWIAESDGDVVNVYMDIETFGEHHDAETGIFDFLLALPAALERRGARMLTPSALAKAAAVDTLSFPTPTSWADTERDASAWLGNRLQQAAHARLYELRGAVFASGDPQLVETWRRLSTSDHFYYMATKWRADGDVHTYFNPHATPYDAYISYMNVLRDLEQRTAADKAAFKTAERTAKKTAYTAAKKRAGKTGKKHDKKTDKKSAKKAQGRVTVKKR